MKSVIEFAGSTIEIAITPAVRTSQYRVYSRSLNDLQSVEVRFTEAEVSNGKAAGLRLVKRDIVIDHEVEVSIDAVLFKKEQVRTEDLRRRIDELTKAAQDELTQRKPAEAVQAVLSALGFK